VKTRLAASLGAAAATSIYRALVDTLVQHLAHLPSVELRFAPEDAVDEIRPWLQPGWRLQPQSSGDLGERIHNAFVEAFAAGADQVIVIGSDCPDIRAEDLEHAWRAMESCDLVLGPAADGGYWLIGLRQPQWALFEQMAWSTPAVLTETLARARQAGLRVVQLRQLRDIDTEADWNDYLSTAKPN
jgi:rSAM/selenodomain-associated transferase 1